MGGILVVPRTDPIVDSDFNFVGISSIAGYVKYANFLMQILMSTGQVQLDNNNNSVITYI